MATRIADGNPYFTIPPVWRRFRHPISWAPMKKLNCQIWRLARSHGHYLWGPPKSITALFSKTPRMASRQSRTSSLHAFHHKSASSTKSTYSWTQSKTKARRWINSAPVYAQLHRPVSLLTPIKRCILKSSSCVIHKNFRGGPCMIQNWHCQDSWP